MARIGRPPDRTGGRRLPRNCQNGGFFRDGPVDLWSADRQVLFGVRASLSLNYAYFEEELSNIWIKNSR